MNAKDLQKIVVRMLFDQTFCDSIYKDPTAVLGELPIAAKTYEWLRRADRRRWHVDTLRCARTLSVLLEEYPASAVLYARHRSLTSMLSFFSSKFFHDAIMDEVPLPLAFGSWLETSVFVDSSMVKLELAIARRRRLIPHAGNQSPYCLSPTTELLSLEEGTLLRYQKIKATLPSDPQDMVKHLMALSTRQDISKRPRSTKTEEFVIVDLSPNGGIGDSSEELYRWLSHFGDGLTHGEMVAMSLTLGLQHNDSLSLLQEMAADGLLIINTNVPT